MYETIKTEQDGATFILTLHRPEKRNIINKQMRAEVVDALMKVRADTSVRAIIVWGGPEVFAAGADLSEMREGWRVSGQTSIELKAEVQDHAYLVMRA